MMKNGRKSNNSTHTHTHTQGNTLSNNFLKIKLILGFRCQGLFLGINPCSFQNSTLKTSLGFLFSEAE